MSNIHMRKRFVLLTLAMVTCTVISMLLAPISLHATIIEETPVPAELSPYITPLFYLDTLILTLTNLSVTWKTGNNTLFMTIKNVTMIARGHTHEDDGTTCSLWYVYIYDFTITSVPLTIEAHFDVLAVFLHLRIKDDAFVYSVQVTRTTNLVSLLWNALRGGLAWYR